MTSDQLSLFDTGPKLPEGMAYGEDVVSAADERALVARLPELPFKEFEFQGYLGKRRVVSFGWHYDFSKARLNRTEDMPDFLLPLRERAAAFAGLAATDLQHALVTEYTPGAGIGWHRDRPTFGDVVGVSLLAPCTFRLRRKTGSTWQRASVIAEPRSAYLLRGPSRTEWEHSIPPLDTLRYSVTFRTLKAEAA
jgi:alkylated DNA repair dioxygenase AlkB